MTELAHEHGALRRVGTSDAEEHAAFWRAMRTDREIDQLSAGRFAGLLGILPGQGGLVATAGSYNQLVRVRGSIGRQQVAVALDLDDGGSGRIHAHGSRVGPDVLLLGGPGAEIDGWWEAGVRIGAVACEREVIDGAAWHVASVGIDELMRADALTPASRTGRALLARLRRLLRAVEDGSAAPLGPAGTAALLDDLLVLLAGNCRPAVARSDGAASRRMRLAEELLRARLDRPVSLAELCAALGVGERTLRAHFHERFGMGPIAFLRRLRLNGSRRALLRGQAQSVTQAAMDWGFCHFGEFSAAYRVQFGELPSSTLRRVRGGVISTGDAA